MILYLEDISIFGALVLPLYWYLLKCLKMWSLFFHYPEVLAASGSVETNGIEGWDALDTLWQSKIKSSEIIERKGKNNVSCHRNTDGRIHKLLFKGGLILAILSALRRGQCAEVRAIKNWLENWLFILNLVINLCRWDNCLARYFSFKMHS